MGINFPKPLKVVYRRTAGDGRPDEEITDGADWCEQLGREDFDRFKEAFDQYAQGEVRDKVIAAVGGSADNIASSQAFQEYCIDLEAAEKQQLMQTIKEII